MSSWEGSACYPRSTFYPLSDGPSMRVRRITLACFRTCSTCRSHSQAHFCQYAPPTVTNRSEWTFASLRYSLGGDHPSQTTRHAMSPRRGLGSRQRKVGISTAAPRALACPLQSVPTMLHIRCPKSMQSCSEGSRGLFVPWRVTGIFTDTTISPGSWRRQCSTH